MNKADAGMISIALENVARAVGRAVFDDDDLDLNARDLLPKNALQRFFDRGAFVVDRKDDREQPGVLTCERATQHESARLEPSPNISVVAGTYVARIDE